MGNSVSNAEEDVIQGGKSRPAPIHTARLRVHTDSYLEQSAHAPIYSLLLVAPFVLTYHVGVLVISHLDANFTERNYADMLIRRFLVDTLGAGPSLVGVVVLAAAFGIWQHESRAPLRFKPSVAGLGFLESFAWAFILFVIPWQIYQALYQHFAPTAVEMQVSAAPDGFSVIRGIVLDCGAGVYEEFVFRVLLVGGLAALGRWGLGWSLRRSGIVAIAVAAVLFSLAHHLPPHGDPAWLPDGSLHPQFLTRFTFRCFAGAYFGALFLFRSFGVAVATHALYDILVTFYHA